ncbi:PXA domain-containing protein [Lineolata rhizophorae]|uniref:PXA domain-containing protein n=1 Tax=Lineolata rhizophorae TaxID=578093 RepID=A0A6A6PAA4_9PEZI|nr:PXA domain-containing protein [Lineolata rhizophorae]
MDRLRRRDVILASIAAFVAWGFVTHWVPPLRFLPYAYVAGVASALGLYLWLVLSTAKCNARPGAGGVGGNSAFRGPRNVAFLSPALWRAEKRALKRRAEYKPVSIYPQSKKISRSIDEILGLIARDFVRSWYGNISPRPMFPNEVDRTVRAALVNIRERLLQVDLVGMVVSRVVPIITSHLKDFYEAEKLVRGRRLTLNVTESEELDLAIAGKFRDGKIHPAASLTYSNTKHIQQQYLRGVVMRLLPKVLPANMTTSTAAAILVKEIVACAVLFPLFQLLADPDTWNQLIENYGRTVLQDRTTVRKLRAALDEHAPASPKATRSQFPKLSPNDNERMFERFIRAIKRCNSLADARRFRSEVASELRKESAVEGQDQVYLRRLEAGKRVLDQRVAYLGAGGSTKKSRLPVQPLPNSATPQTSSRLENASLKDVLYDASGLSYFMECMDRQGLMRLVQFWIVVDGFRNPLELDTDDPRETLGQYQKWSDSDRIDLAQINEAYLSKPELKIPSASRQAVKDFLKAGSNATPLQYATARSAVLKAQTAIYETMQHPHFDNFRKSDLYFKWLASDDRTKASSLSPKTTDDIPDMASIIKEPERPTAKHGVTSANLRFLQPDLRRTAASSSDLKGSGGKLVDPGLPARRSLDDGRAPLFDDDYDSDPLARSTASLESEPPAGNDVQVVDAMQAALNDIMENEEHDKDSLFSDLSLHSPQDNDSTRGSLDLPRAASPAPRKDAEKPSLASLGLVSTPKRHGAVFSDDLFGDEQEKFIEDEREDSEVDEKPIEDEIHEAAPGDLGLAEAIDALSLDIERLVTQESIVDSLTRKAELTNNAAELRILKKSKASLQREIHRKELQRQQYIVQESENSLYGRASVTIQSIMLGTEDDGKEYALYVIEVKRQAGELMPAAAWVITRRYSEFHDLNKRLRARYPQVRNLEFPRRQMVLKLQKDFLQKRRMMLEKYLRDLLQIPAICRSRELRAFLSSSAIAPVNGTSAGNAQADSRDFVSRIYNSVTDGMDEFLGNIPVLDQLSLAGQNLISAATSQLNAQSGGGSANSTPTSSTAPRIPSNLVASAVATGSQADPDAEAQAELAAFEASSAASSQQLEPFVKPICDLFLEAFELNRDSNWLRGRAVVVVLHQLLGGTIERKVRESTRAQLQEDTVVKYLDVLKEAMWPGGKPKAAPGVAGGTIRTAAEKAKSRREAGVVLATLVPELAGSVVGRGNAGAASRRFLATMNNQRLNTHLVFTLLDEFVGILFGEAVPR